VTDGRLRGVGGRSRRRDGTRLCSARSAGERRRARMLQRRDFRWRTRRASIAAEARFPGADARAGGIPDGGHHGAPGEGGEVPGAGGRRARGVHRGGRKTHAGRASRAGAR
jgi:hypothetical protein